MSGQVKTQAESGYVRNASLPIGTEKECPKCGIPKTLDEFYDHKGRRNGKHSWCKACVRDAVNNRQAKNPERKKAYNEKYRAANLLRIREQEKKRKPSGWAIRKAASTVWRDAHRDQIREQSRNWAKRNPETVLDNTRRRRAIRKNATVEKFAAAEIFERDRWKCQLCRKPVNKKLRYPNPMSASLDHIIPLSMGGSHERKNAQLAHFSCNNKTGVRGIKQLRLL